jgi:hypothetical protein
MLLSKRISQKNLTYGGIWNLALAASEYVLLCQHMYFCTKAAIKLSSKPWKRRKLALAPSVFVLLYQQLRQYLYFCTMKARLSLLALLVQKYKYWHLKEKEASVLCARLLVAACSIAGRNHIHELHTSAYVSIRQHTSAHVSTRQHTSAYVSIRQHTSAHVSIRQHTSAYVCIFL